MKKVFYVFIILIIIVSACKSEETKKKIAQVDSLIVEIKTMNDKLLNINIDTINYVFDILSVNIEYLGQEGISFPDDSELKNKFANYGTIFKFLKKYLQRYNGLQKEIDFSKNHLAGLKRDVENKLLSDSIFFIYFNDEKRILNKLIFEVDQSLNKIEPQVELFFEINSTIEQFIEKSKATNNIPDKKLKK